MPVVGHPVRGVVVEIFTPVIIAKQVPDGPALGVNATTTTLSDVLLRQANSPLREITTELVCRSVHVHVSNRRAVLF